MVYLNKITQDRRYITPYPSLTAVVDSHLLHRKKWQQLSLHINNKEDIINTMAKICWKTSVNSNKCYLFFSSRSSRFRVVSSITADADKFPFRTILSSLGFNVCTKTIRKYAYQDTNKNKVITDSRLHPSAQTIVSICRSLVLTDQNLAGIDAVVAAVTLSSHHKSCNGVKYVKSTTLHYITIILRLSGFCSGLPG